MESWDNVLIVRGVYRSDNQDVEFLVIEHFLEIPLSLHQLDVPMTDLIRDELNS